MSVATRWRRLRGSGVERGSAVVEFVFLAVLMMLPLFYLVVTLARVQAGAFAVTAASREAGRAYVTAADQRQAPGRAQAAAELAFSDQGFGGRGRIDVTCDRSPCLSPEGKVEVVASLDVPLPMVPDFLDGVLPTSVSVSADHVSPVDRFRSRP